MKNKNILVALAVFVVILIGIIFAINKNTQPKIEGVTTITLSGGGFNPQHITIAHGTRVVWINKSGREATVNSDPHPAHNLYPILQLGNFEAEDTLQAVFDKAGTYTYHNHLNPSQKGTIIVQ